MRKHLIKTVAAFLGLAMLLGLAPETSEADSVTVTPPRFELFANPGDVLTEKVKIRNESSSELTYQVEVEDFSAKGDDGSVDFVDPEVSRESFSLARWVTVEPSRFTIPAAQERILTFNIRVPRTAEPGGKYASVLIKRSSEAAPGIAAVESRIGSLVLLRVSGNVKEDIKLESFRPENAFQQYGPVVFNMRYKNDGNVHVAPTGTLVITNMFGRKVKEIPLRGTSILPEASRVIKADWEEKNMVGRYTASLVVSYGQANQSITSSASFIVFPFYLLGIILAGIALLYLLVAKRKAIRRLINNLTRE
jgi:hypothetical protein